MGRPAVKPHIRKLRRGEVGAFAAHLLRLDPESRRRRFGRVVADAYVVDYARAEPTRPGLVEGAFVDGVLRGTGELRPFGEGRAEMTFTVERGFQRRGMGTALFRRLLLVARNDGVGDLTLVCLPENGPMQRLARRHGATLVAVPGEVACTVRGGGLTPASLWQEEIVELGGRLGTAWDWWLANNPIGPVPAAPDRA